MLPVSVLLTLLLSPSTPALSVASWDVQVSWKVVHWIIHLYRLLLCDLCHISWDKASPGKKCPPLKLMRITLKANASSKKKGLSGGSGLCFLHDDDQAQHPQKSKRRGHDRAFTVRRSLEWRGPVGWLEEMCPEHTASWAWISSLVDYWMSRLLDEIWNILFLCYLFSWVA